MAKSSDVPAGDLPLSDTGTSKTSAAVPAARRGLTWQVIPLVVAAFITGGVFGLYFQPPGLRAFFGATGLEPGGGTDTPIAVAIRQVQAQEEVAVVSEGDIVALGRILPEGDVLAVAAPFGGGDARVDSIHVAVGDAVTEGQTLAVLDNETELENALKAAQATLRVREATLLQTRESIRASREEAAASLARAEATAVQAQAELERVQPLFERGVTTRTDFDLAKARADEAMRDIERNRATLSRYQSNSGTVQADIAVAEANLGAAQVDLARAEADLARSVVRSPIDGTILKIHTQIGERPSSEGLFDVGNTTQMTVEAEVYQTMIGRVAIGDPVTVSAEALNSDLRGVVEAIGLEIGRQSITSEDPAANTDARVVDVIVRLDAESSRLAERFTNLETVVRIDAGRAE